MTSVDPHRRARSRDDLPDQQGPVNGARLSSEATMGILIILRSADAPFEVIAQNALEEFVTENQAQRPIRQFPIAYDWGKIHGWVRSQLKSDEEAHILVGQAEPDLSATMEMDKIDSIGAWQARLARYYQVGTLPTSGEGVECLTLYATIRNPSLRPSLSIASSVPVVAGAEPHKRQASLQGRAPSACPPLELPVTPISISKTRAASIELRPSKRADISDSRGKRAEHMEVIDLLDIDEDNAPSSEPRPANIAHFEDDDADREGHRKQVEDIGRQFANRSISAKDWNSLCRMFQCPEDIEEYRPAGFKLAISAYQLHAVWWQLTQFPVRGVPGGCLGDEMGLGKTIEVITVFAVFAIIKMNYIEVRKHWEDGEIVAGREHLPRNQDNMGDLICPSQHLSPFGLLCPCVKLGETYLVATKLPSLPSICFAPPSSIHGWRREFDNLIDVDHPVMQTLKFSIMHNELKGDETYYHSESRVVETMAKATRCYVNQRGQPECHLRGRVGLSN